MSPGRPCRLKRSRTIQARCGAVGEAELEVGERRAGEQQQVGKLLVEASAQGAEQQDFVGATRLRRQQRQFEIGGVFVGGVLLDGRAQFAQAGEIVGVQAVEVADDEGGAQTEGEGMPRAAIRTDDEVIGLQLAAYEVGCGQVAVGEENDAHGWGGGEERRRRGGDDARRR